MTGGMFKSLFLFALGLFSALAAAQNSTADDIGYTGVLSSLDGGLGGTVTVINANTLLITGYTLMDASAPALFWWGTTDGVIKDGFRISNEQVTMAATSNMLTIKLDAGKTSADFTTVGLWCEHLNANFGQATLKAPTTAGTSTTSTLSVSAMTTTASVATPSATKSGAGFVGVSYGALFTSFVAAAVFATWMG